MILIQRNSDQTIFEQIYLQIRSKIESGEILPGEKLPSIRSFSKEYKISKGTTEKAYNQLATEGYIISSPRSGYRAEDILKHALPSYLENADKIRKKKTSTEGSDNLTNKKFASKAVDRGLFSFKQWKKSINLVLDYKQRELEMPMDPRGELQLRKAITAFSKKHRGTIADPDQVIVAGGSEILLTQISYLFDQRIIAFEDPGFTRGAKIFENQGYDLVKIPVQADGMAIDAIEDSDVKLVYVSPAHQYPTGAVMSIKKRLQLLHYAQSHDNTIIEDDYDGFLSYDMAPIPSLQGLSKNSDVIYLGSFAKSTAPSIRISYMILPLHTAQSGELKNSLVSQSCPKLTQLAFAEFLSSGNMDSHIRKIRKHYENKAGMIRDALQKRNIETSGWGSGTHYVLPKISEKAVSALSKLGIEIEIIGGIGATSFSGIENHQIEEYADLIAASI